MGHYCTQENFEIFTMDGLEERMSLIRKHIQPVFQSGRLNQNRGG